MLNSMDGGASESLSRSSASKTVAADAVTSSSSGSIDNKRSFRRSLSYRETSRSATGPSVLFVART
jgi:hypothetical protein